MSDENHTHVSTGHLDELLGAHMLDKVEIDRIPTSHGFLCYTQEMNLSFCAFTCINTFF
jgi:hypothetical protein